MRLKSNLTKIAQTAPAAAKRALLQTGKDIAELTRQITPVDTGALRDSYKAEPISDSVVLVGTETTYAPFVEYGTSKSEAQPHLTPAFAQSEATFKARLTEEAEKLQ
jgi:HK97 gp10 family phage protein